MQSAKLLLKEGGKVIASTIQENRDMMKELLCVAPQKFLPSIPHLVRRLRLLIPHLQQQKRSHQSVHPLGERR